MALCAKAKARQAEGLPRNRRTTSVTKNNTIKTTNRICATSADAPAVPPKPSAAANKATSRNVKAQPSIAKPPKHSPHTGLFDMTSRAIPMFGT